MTKDEDATVQSLIAEFNDHSRIADAREIVETYFTAADGTGRLRMQEHPLYSASFDLEFFVKELSELFSTPVF